MNKKTISVLSVLGIGAAGAFLAASAASLSVSATANLQAGTDDLLACQTGAVNVALAAPTWSDGASDFTVTTVNLSGISDICKTANANIKVTALDASGAAITGASGTGTIATGTADNNTSAITLGTADNSASVKSLAVVIY